MIFEYFPEMTGNLAGSTMMFRLIKKAIFKDQLLKYQKSKMSLPWYCQERIYFHVDLEYRVKDFKWEESKDCSHFSISNAIQPKTIRVRLRIELFPSTMKQYRVFPIDAERAWQMHLL